MERSYRIQNLELYGFSTGTTRDGGQVLMGALYDELLTVFFDSEGHFLRVEERPLSRLPPKPSPQSYDRSYEERCRKIVTRDLRARQQELGFEPKTITVRKFFLPEKYVGIEDFPDFLDEFMRDPQSIAEDAAHEARLNDILREWKENGNFVFWWGQDYHMDGEGDVEST